MIETVRRRRCLSRGRQLGQLGIQIGEGVVELFAVARILHTIELALDICARKLQQFALAIQFLIFFFHSGVWLGRGLLAGRLNLAFHRLTFPSACHVFII
jgi:hypothetical protein